MNGVLWYSQYEYGIQKLRLKLFLMFGKFAEAIQPQGIEIGTIQKPFLPCNHLSLQATPPPPPMAGGLVQLDHPTAASIFRPKPLFPPPCRPPSPFPPPPPPIGPSMN